MKYIKTYENKKIDKNYPYKEISLLCDPYIDEHYKEWENQGWGVFNATGNSHYKNKFGITTKDDYLDIQRFDEINILLDDDEAIKLAKKTRLNIKYDGLIIGLDNIDFIGMNTKDFKTYEFQKEFLENHGEWYLFIKIIGYAKNIEEEFDYIFDSKKLGLL